MQHNFDDIVDFHKKFEQPGPQTPTLLATDLYDFRVKFLKEELQEFIDAHDADDLPTAADSLVDLVYVALGTAHLMGLPWQKLWDCVHSANMKKRLAKSADESKRGYKMDVVKPEGWLPPDVARIIRMHSRA